MWDLYHRNVVTTKFPFSKAINFQPRTKKDHQITEADSENC